MNLPCDVTEYINKRYRKRLVICLVIEMLIITMLILFGELLFGSLHDIARYSLYGVIVAVPIFLTGVLAKVFDKSFEGEVIDVKVRSVYAASNEAKPRLYGKNIIELAVKKEDGKVDFIDVKEHPYTTDNLHWLTNRYTDLGTKRPEHFLGDYKVGYKVYHFRGIKGYLVVDPDRDDLAYCVVCGGRESSSETICKNCGHTLIK